MRAPRSRDGRAGGSGATERCADTINRADGWSTRLTCLEPMLAARPAQCSLEALRHVGEVLIRRRQRGFRWTLRSTGRRRGRRCLRGKLRWTRSTRDHRLQALTPRQRASRPIHFEVPARVEALAPAGTIGSGVKFGIGSACRSATGAGRRTSSPNGARAGRCGISGIAARGVRRYLPGSLLAPRPRPGSGASRGGDGQFGARG